MRFDGNGRGRANALRSVLMFVILGLGGCGSSDPSNLLMDEARRIGAPYQEAIEASVTNDEYLKNLHQGTAMAIDEALQRYPNAEAELRQVLSEMRDVERQLASGEIRGQEATAIRQQHNEYWSQIDNGNIPTGS